MSAAVETDVESIEHLDFVVHCSIVVLLDSIAEPGGYTRTSCTRPAQWIVRCRTCGYIGQACDAHMHLMSVDPISGCVCGVRGPGVELFEFTPLSQS